MIKMLKAINVAPDAVYLFPSFTFFEVIRNPFSGEFPSQVR